MVFSVGGPGHLVGTVYSQGQQLKEISSMKKILVAVALIVASAAPALAQEFPNSYATDSETMHN